jgi:hypothetical protein
VGSRSPCRCASWARRTLEWGNCAGQQQPFRIRSPTSPFRLCSIGHTATRRDYSVGGQLALPLTQAPISRYRRRGSGSKKVSQTNLGTGRHSFGRHLQKRDKTKQQEWMAGDGQVTPTHRAAAGAMFALTSKNRSERIEGGVANHPLARRPTRLEGPDEDDFGSN